MSVSDAIRIILEDYVEARQKQSFPGRFREVFQSLAAAVKAQGSPH